MLSLIDYLTIKFIKQRQIFFCLLLSAATLFGVSAASAASNNPHVSILQYHHVSESTPAVTSISPSQFEAHMAYLDEFHTVVALEDVVAAFANKTMLPENAVAITFDDGYKNILENGHPILQKYGFKYTIFINPSEIGSSQAQLNWTEVKLMASQGVTFANHTLDHAHLLTRYPRESDENWRKRVRKDITTAETLIQEQVGYSRKWLAYPYGEFDLALQALLEEIGFVGFGQQSGTAAWYSNQFALPRFPAAGRYANLDTLITKMRSLAMPVLHVKPMEPKVAVGQSPGNVSISVDTDGMNVRQFACYFKGDKLEINTRTLSAQETSLLQNRIYQGAPESAVVEFSFDINEVLSPGRSRVNCTAPSTQTNGRFFWYSMPWFTATEDGEYLD